MRGRNGQEPPRPGKERAARAARASGRGTSGCAGCRIRRRRRSSGCADRLGRVDGRLRGNGERRSNIGRCHYRRSADIHVPAQVQTRDDGHSGRGSVAAGAVALAQSGIGRPKDGTGKPQHVGSPSWTYHILVSRNGEPPRKVAVVEMTGDTPIRVDAPGALILFQPKRDGEPDRQNAAEERSRGNRVEGIDLQHHKIVLTSPKAKDVIITQQYVCQIHSQRHIKVCALENGYLEEITVKEGQAVKKGDLMFKIVPTLYKAKLDAELAEAKLAELEFNNTKKLFNEKRWSLRMRWHCSRPNWQRPRPRRSWRRPN